MNCDCGSERTFEQCCGPFLAGAPAPTAEALMRSRYTAYVRHEIDYILSTSDPKTRSEINRESIEHWSRDSTWLGLTVHETVDGKPGDEEGIVDFSARWRQGREEQLHHERARFQKIDGRWHYIDTVAPNRVPVRREERPAPNAPCHCGSGKKYKRCHGV